MALPKSVQRAAKAADDQVAEILAAETAPLTVNPDTGEPIAQHVEPAPVVPPAPSEDFAQKYRTLQGKYDAELPVLRGQITTYERINANLAAQVSQLTEQVARISAERREAPVASVADAVTDKDIEQYGSDLVGLINRVADAKAAAYAASIQQRVDDATGAAQRDLAGVKLNQQQTERALYEQRLTEAVPDWRVINVDPEWLAWLGEFDPVLGSTRQAALGVAYIAFDAPRTVAFLTAFQRSRAPRQPVVTPQDELARQVTPHTSGQPAAPVVTNTPSTRIWTQAEIGDAYKAKLQGKYKFSPDAWEAVAKEMDQAVAEGRVR